MILPKEITDQKKSRAFKLFRDCAIDLLVENPHLTYE